MLIELPPRLEAVAAPRVLPQRRHEELPHREAGAAEGRHRRQRRHRHGAEAVPAVGARHRQGDGVPGLQAHHARRPRGQVRGLHESI